jgi:hypothetical protein
VSTAARPSSDARAVSVQVTAEEIIAHLADGRTISVPLAWSWRLSDATVEQRRRYELIGDGSGIHWPDVDEDISVRGMLDGIPARRPARR